MSEPLVFPEHLTDFEAEQSRHHEVKENKLRQLSARDFDGVLAIVGLENGKSFPFKSGGDKSAEEFLVIDDEYFRLHDSFCSRNWKNNTQHSCCKRPSDSRLTSCLETY